MHVANITQRPGAAPFDFATLVNPHGSSSWPAAPLSMAQIARFYQDCTLALTFAARQLSLIFLQSSFRCQIVRIPGSKPMSFKYIPYSCHAKSLWTLVDTFLPSRIWIISVHPHILTSPIRYAAQSIILNLWDGETSLPQLDKALSCQAQLNMLAARLLVLRQQPCEPMWPLTSAPWKPIRCSLFLKTSRALQPQNRLLVPSRQKPDYPNSMMMRAFMKHSQR